jgi:hypothetical protein
MDEEPIGATECAVAIQTVMAERDYGDGINIAAEALAQPGGASANCRFGSLWLWLPGVPDGRGLTLILACAHAYRDPKQEHFQPERRADDACNSDLVFW